MAKKKEAPAASTFNEQVAKEIESIAEGMRKLDKGRLSRRAVVLLIKDVTGLPQTDIRAVLDAAVTLDQVFLKKFVRPIEPKTTDR